MRELALRALAAAVSAAGAELPENPLLWTRLIAGLDGDPYITRTLGPRLFGHRVLLHRIHREDADPDLHNHPWRTARFLILTGGYIEERLLPSGDLAVRHLQPGDVNKLDASTFHRVTSVNGNTWTLGLVGERVQEWGFLVDGKLVLSGAYFKQRGYVAGASAGKS